MDTVYHRAEGVSRLGYNSRMRLISLTCLSLCLAASACSPLPPAIETTPIPTLPTLPATAPLPTIAVVPTASDAHPLGESRVRLADQAVMMYVPSGRFVMGSDSQAVAAARKLCRQYSGKDAIGVCTQAAFENEYPAHPVSLDGFWLDRNEVTNSQYQRCAEAGACTPPVESGSYYRTSYYGDPAFANHPVIWVRQEQAAEYCRWAGGRLPSEAEWEYAARGPEARIFPWGNEFDGSRLNYCDRNCDAGPNDPAVDDGYADTAPVGSYPAGASWVGALDMAGNVREWAADWYGKYPDGEQVNPQGPQSGEGHIPRGGAWLDKPDDVRSANRGENSPDYTRHKVGFRCAMDAVNESSPAFLTPQPASTPTATTAAHNTYYLGLGPQMGQPCHLLYYDDTLKLEPDCPLRLTLSDRVGVTRYFGVSSQAGTFSMTPDVEGYREPNFALLACPVVQVDDNICVFTLSDGSGDYRLEIRVTGVD